MCFSSSLNSIYKDTVYFGLSVLVVLGFESIASPI